MWLGLLRERDERRQVAAANCVGLATFFEALHGEIANGLQHEEAWFIEIRKAPKQALVG